MTIREKNARRKKVKWMIKSKKMTRKAIAAKYCCSLTLIDKIVNGER